MELTLTKFVTNHCDPPVLRRLSSECVASMLTHPLCWMPAHTVSSCSLIGCREMMLENVTLDKSGYGFNILTTAFTTCFTEHKPSSKSLAVKKSHLIKSEVHYHHGHNCQLLDSSETHIFSPHSHTLLLQHVIIPYDPSLDTFISQAASFPSGFMTKFLGTFSSLLCRLL